MISMRREGARSHGKLVLFAKPDMTADLCFMGYEKACLA